MGKEAWLAGLASTPGISKVTYLVNEYRQEATETRLPEIIDVGWEKNWNAIYNHADIFGLTDNDLRQIQSKADVAPWATVAYERTYSSSCSRDDYFDFLRSSREFLSARLPWFDINPQFIEDQVDLLKEVTDTLLVYPGARNYACFTGSGYCAEGDFNKNWEREPDCFYPLILEYFNEETVNSRAEKISNSIRSFDKPYTVQKKENDVLSPQKISLEEPSWWENNDYQLWTVKDLQFKLLEEPWKRSITRLSLPGAPLSESGYFLGAVSNNEDDVGEEVIMYTPGTHFSLADIDLNDFFVEVYAFGGEDYSLVFEGKKIDLPVDGWQWVRVARRLATSSRPSWTINSPEKGKGTKIGGLRLISVSQTLNIGEVNNIQESCAVSRQEAVELVANKKTTWNDLEIQEWLSGEGWIRDPSAYLTFSPEGFDDDHLPYSTEIVALPGRPSQDAFECPEARFNDYERYYRACVYISTNGLAKLAYTLPPQSAGYGEIVTSEIGWVRLGGSFSYANNYPKRYNYKLLFQPLPGTDPFKIKSVKLVGENEDCNSN